MAELSKPKNVAISKMSGWLPAVAAFLCLSMFVMAALTLLQVGADPKSPPQASVTSVSAQGFQGLRRLLDADGHTTVLNRYESGPHVARGDLEIITLDAGGMVPDFGRPVPPDADSASSESASASASDSASEGAEASKGIDTAAVGNGFFPYEDQATHILYAPLGRAILVVAPKWTARQYPRNPRWARGPELAEPTSIRAMLAELSPMTEVKMTYDDEGEAVPPLSGPGQGVYFNHNEETTVIYDKVPYVITRSAAASAVSLRPVAGGAPVPAGKVTSLQSITGPNLTPVLVGPNGEALLSRVEVNGGRKATAVPVYLLSDPDLLNNQILSDPQRVVAALSLIDRVTPGDKPSKVVFNITFNGLSFDRDLLHTLARPPYLGVSLAGLILGLGLMWAAFARFGPAEVATAGSPLGRGVRTLADNAARLMALTLKEIRLGPAYATLMRDQVIKARGHGATRDVPTGSAISPQDDLAERIGRSHRATDSYLDLKDKAARVATVHQLIDVTRKLHAWKTEIERGHN